MFKQIKNLLVCFRRTPKAHRIGTVDIVTLISSRMQMIGLCSYTSMLKVHWAANVSALCFLIVCITQVIAFIMAKGDPEKLFECFSVLSFCVMGVLKLISLRTSHIAWKKLVNQITILEKTQLNKGFVSSVEYESDDEESDDFSVFINSYTKKFKSMLTIMTRVYGFTAFIFIVSPFVEHVICKLRGMECVTYPHILPGWAPLDDISIYGYIVTVLCEFVGAIYCVSVHTAFDAAAVGITTFVCGQFSLLRYCSSCIGGKGKRCNLSMRRDERAHFRITRCAETNIILVSTITELDKLLKRILGVYFFIATLTLCTVAVRLNSEQMSIMQLVSLTQYMCGTLIQLFLFCRYGDAVMNESSMGTGEGPFAAASWCLSPRVRRDLAMLGAGMMRRRHLHAGPFNFLDLPSFIQVVRTAYSYYAVLGKRQ